MLTTLRVLEALVGVALVFAALDAMVRTFLLHVGSPWPAPASSG